MPNALIFLSGAATTLVVMVLIALVDYLREGSPIG